MAMKKTLIILILIVAILSIVWHRSIFSAPKVVSKAVSKVTSKITSNAAPKQIYIQCPKIKDAQKNPKKGNWIAKTTKGYWKSYDMSFATHLTQFVGAQWSGAEMGQVTCIYNSQQKFTMNGQLKREHTLPVLLVFHTLTFKPMTGKWKRFSVGVYNCYSRKQSDCQYVMQIKAPPGNIYQEAEALKKQ